MGHIGDRHLSEWIPDTHSDPGRYGASEQLRLRSCEYSASDWAGSFPQPEEEWRNLARCIQHFRSALTGDVWQSASRAVLRPSYQQYRPGYRKKDADQRAVQYRISRRILQRLESYTV